MTGVLQTGLSHLDDHFGGIPASGITAIAGYPTTGKSQLLWTLATGLSVPVLFFGEKPELSPGWHQSLSPSCHLDDSPHDNLGVVVGLVHEAARHLGVGAVFVDDLNRYLGHRYSSTRSKLRRSVLQLPRELGISLVASYTVTRQVSAHRHAHWSDLRGTVIEDPDLLMLLHPESAIPPITTLHAICQDGHSPIVSERLHMRF